MWVAYPLRVAEADSRLKWETLKFMENYLYMFPCLNKLNFLGEKPEESSKAADMLDHSRHIATRQYSDEHIYANAGSAFWVVFASGNLHDGLPTQSASLQQKFHNASCAFHVVLRKIWFRAHILAVYTRLFADIYLGK